MRRRLALLVSATMALMLLAFVLPLAILIKVNAADQAVAEATDNVRAVSAQVAAAPNDAAIRAILAARQPTAPPVTVFLPGRNPLPGPAPRTLAVRLAASSSSSFSVAEPAAGGSWSRSGARAAPRSSRRSSAMPRCARGSCGRGWSWPCSA